MRFIFTLLWIPVVGFGQQKTVQQSVRNGSIALGSWSAVNMISAGALVKNSDGPTLYFHQMNGYWNTVNGTLALATLLAPEGKRTKGLSPSELAQRCRKVYAFNAGLDLGYMATGAALWATSASSIRPAMNEGYGKSLLLQGGFLLIYDGIMAQRMKSFTNASNSVSFSVQPMGFSLVYRP